MTDKSHSKPHSVSHPEVPKTILCYGDSNTFGYNPADGMRYPEDVRWPGVLRQRLGSSFRIIEEGCNGRTAAHTPAEEIWKDGRPYLPACLNSHKPLDAVVLMLGSNDLKTEFSAQPETIAAGIGQMLRTIRDFLQLKQGSVPYILLISPPHIGKGITHSPFAGSFDVSAPSRSQKLAPLYEKALVSYAAGRIPSAGTDSGRTVPAPEATDVGRTAPAPEATDVGRTAPKATDAAIHCGFLDAGVLIKPSSLDSLHLTPQAHRILGEAIADHLLSVL